MDNYHLLTNHMDLKRRLDTIINGGRFFHAFIAAPGLADYLAAAAVCTGFQKPCGKCQGCVKARNNTHPDISTVERQNTEITVGQIRAMRVSAFNKPNEAPRKAVIIREADSLNRSAQNALLNILEEPPGDVMFILETGNEDALLHTIISRCVKLRMQNYAAVIDEKFSERSDTILNAFAAGNNSALLREAASLEKMKRDELYGVISHFRETIINILLGRYSGSLGIETIGTLHKKSNIKRLMTLADECGEFCVFLEANVGVGLVAGCFTAAIITY